jgi:DNA replication protein DnaC
MSPEQIDEHLHALNLKGMAEVARRYFNERPRPDVDAQVMVAQMVEAQLALRRTQKTTARLRTAAFREQVTADQIDWNHPRGLRKADVQHLLSGNWVDHAHNVAITGATGLGKSFLACAIGHRMCELGRSVLFRRATRLFDEMKSWRADGGYLQKLAKLKTTDILIIDDFGLEPMDAVARRDMMELMEDRYALRSTIITSQFDPAEWHAAVGAPLHADSILDRLVHNAISIRLTGESVRKTRGQEQLKNAGTQGNDPPMKPVAGH